jgi:hypothetical protein
MAADRSSDLPLKNPPGSLRAGSRNDELAGLGQAFRDQFST